MHSTSCLSLNCIVVVGLGAPLSRFLEGVLRKFLKLINENVKYCKNKQIYQPKLEINNPNPNNTITVRHVG